MSRRPNRFGALLVLFLSGQAMALGLGEIRLDSALNEPLRAEIQLLSATPEELENLTVQMAAGDLFERYGLDRPGFLSSVSFRILRSGGAEGNVIAVTSTQPITEPFLTFLVEASWQRGRLLREYTVLLDPPTFAPPPAAPVTEAVQPPVRSQAADSGQIQRPAPSQAPGTAPVPPATPSAAAPSVPASVDASPDDAIADDVISEDRGQQQTPTEATPAPAGGYQVQRGDTLWSIANRYQPDNRLTVNQTMLAIFEANPDAFSGNINSMAAGASLRIPSADEIFRITRADALAEVQRQNSTWDGGFVAGTDSGPAPVPQPSLELVPPDEDSLSGESNDVDPVTDQPEPETVADPDALRIAEIEALLSDQQDGLVEVADTELAALQRELAELRGEELPPEPTVTEPEAPAEDALPAEDDVFVAEEPDVVDEPELAGDDANVAAETVSEPAAAPTPQESIVDKVLGYATGIWGLVGLAIALVIGGLLFFIRRSSGSSPEDDAPAAADATAMWNTLDDGDFAEKTIAEEPSAEQTSQMPAMPPSGDTTIVVEEAGRPEIDDVGDFSPTMELPAAPAPEIPEQQPATFNEDTAANPALEDTFSSETALNLDQSDPIAEADFHMAYGLYDQAADLIVGALEVEPERTDYIAKLCEIYFVWGNRDSFVDAAERFKGVIGNSPDPEWDKTVIMGQQIAGDHALFSDAPAGATKAVDLAFDDEGEDAALDMDLAVGSDGGDDFIDLGEDDPVRVAGGETNTAVDFSFDDAGGDTAATGATEVMPAADALAAEFGDDDIKTAEMPAFDEATAEMPTVDASLDSTAESPADDFMDSDATGAMPQLAADDATALASLDDLPSADATSEIDLDDLGLDLDALDNDLESISSDLESMDDGTQDLPIGDDVLAATGRNEALDLPDDEDSAANLLDATGQTQVLPGDFAVETGTGTNIEKALSEEDNPLAGDAETMMASLDDDDDDIEFAKTEALSDDMELDLDDLTAALEVNSGDDATIEQPMDSGHAVELDDSPTAAFSADGLSDELSDARTMTEVGTKLDLARAYVDMGDPGGAKSILEEVLEEGDDAQRQQAQQLLDSLS